MTTPPKAKRYHITDDDRQPKAPEAAEPSAPATPGNVGEQIAAIRKEGLTGRQLRLARRVAQKHGLSVSSDFDAVRQLRAQGIDPFQKSNLLDLVKADAKPETDKTPAEKANSAPPARPQLPQKFGSGTSVRNVSVVDVKRKQALDERAGELRKLQQEIARRRQRNLVLLALRLAFFILLPTLIAGYYYFGVATRMYATKSEFLIQQSNPPSASGFGGLFAGTSMATQQDSIAVQSYLSSREAMIRLDKQLGFRDEFSAPDIDPLQRLPADASLNKAYDLYKKQVQLSYDPTEGLVRMEVIATSAERSMAYSRALIEYAEERVDQMTSRMRQDQMAGAQEAFDDAETARQDALTALTEAQIAAGALDPTAEVGALIGRISSLEGQRDKLSLELAALRDNRRPNETRVNATAAQIDRLEDQITDLRAQITDNQAGRMSQTLKAAKVREAEENYQNRLLQLNQALTSMETARVEANRQVRYLSLSVTPVPPDSPTHPRAFESTVVAFFVFAGIYLMIALTTAILREQVSA